MSRAVPTWVRELVNQITRYIDSEQNSGPIGFRVYFPKKKEPWVILIFQRETEVYGGEKDGLSFSPAHAVCMHGLMDVLSNFHIDMLVPNNKRTKLKPYLNCRGRYRSHKVIIRILTESPEEAKPGRVIDMIGSYGKKRKSRDA